MKYTQLVSIEITTKCNLADRHARCPNTSPERYRYLDTRHTLNDDIIVSTVKELYQHHGFRGLVAWHYYCEPLIEYKRIMQLMGRIRAEVPDARFLLWTNGTLLPEEPEPLRAFERIVITDYGGINKDRLDKLQATHDGVSVHNWPLDDRLQIEGRTDNSPCARMFVEFIIDNYGNVHPCCYDWKGRGTLGNIFSEGLANIIIRWQTARDRISGREMQDNSPAVCKTCKHKSPKVAAMLPPIISSPGIVRDTQDRLKRLRLSRPEPEPCVTDEEVSKRKIAVVFVSYLKVPKQRLKDHFKWNRTLYKKYKAKIYVVTDKEQWVPRCAKCVVYPMDKLPVVDGKPRFSLCATKNAGVEAAIADGADVVLCVDVDHAFPTPCWKQMVAVNDHTASIPVYRMMQRHGDMEGSELDHGCTGAISMTAANWKKIRWDERCVGYGADDGLIMREIKKQGLQVVRDMVIEHIEHPGATHEKNVPGHGRVGCYGRDEFNFDNFDNNRRLHAGRA